MKNAQARIDLNALYKNAKTALEKTDGKVIAIVKNDAYHFGLIKSVNTFYDTGIRAFATTSLRDAIKIRKELDSSSRQADIILLNQVIDFDSLRKYDICPTLPSLEYLQEFHDEMHSIRWHLEWAGEMRRSGATSEEELLKTLSLAKEYGLTVEGIWTHFAWADEFDENHTYEGEKERWLNVLEKAKKIHKFKYIHAQNSASFMRDGIFPEHSHVRIGIYLYGCPPYSSADKSELNHAFELFGYVITVNELKENESIGYGASFRAKNQSKVAVINLGYGDGLLRKRVVSHPVEINGKRYPLVSMMMSHTVALVDDSVKRGDKVYFYSKSIPLDEFAALGVGTASEQVTSLDFGTIDLEYIELEK